MSWKRCVGANETISECRRGTIGGLRFASVGSIEQSISLSHEAHTSHPSLDSETPTSDDRSFVSSWIAEVAAHRRLLEAGRRGLTDWELHHLDAVEVCGHLPDRRVVIPLVDHSDPL
jgi:hypothetical protein